jgi:dTDP-glucose pyrophosphorylase
MKSTALVLAAGLGTRYGGLKQIDAVGPYGQTLIDYCVYDALKAGFDRMVFVIRHYFENAFKEQVSSKFDRFVETVYAYQEIDAGVGDFAPPPGREKPWGTGHAILVSRELISEPFAVVNADDYYGLNALKAIFDFLTAERHSANDHAMVGYILRNTLSDYGTVCRGVCECDGDMFLRRVVERRNVEKTPTGARYIDPDGTIYTLSGDEIVSMNLWGFQPSIFERIEMVFGRFLKKHGSSTSAELFIPTVVDELLQKADATVKVLKTKNPWFGVTYRQDRTAAAQCIRKLTDQGHYPERLWIS